VNAAQLSQGEVHNLTSQITQAEKLASLGQIAAGMVHELNNPLTSIVAYTDYLSKRWVIKRDADPNGDAADELERLRRISDSAHRLLRFTRDLVTYARPSSETPVPVVVHGVIDQALAFCEHVLAESKTSVDRHFGDGILPVRGLPEQLTQVFVNLVTNACHAMPESGGRVSISTELVDNDRSVRICLSDTGEGISASNVARIFLPFFTTKANGRGTGLGLSIVQNIIEAHGGRITVESELAKGTSFTMILPVANR
jgi:signal transduction histidine kinase